MGAVQCPLEEQLLKMALMDLHHNVPDLQGVTQPVEHLLQPPLEDLWVEMAILEGQLKFLDNQCRWLPNKKQLNLYLSSVQIYFLKLSRYLFIQKFKKFKTKILKQKFYYYILDAHHLLPLLSLS